MKLVLASIVDWDGATQVGVFSDREKAFTACKNFLFRAEGTYPTEVGFVSDFKNDEPIAYLVEWFSNEIYKFANKHDKI